MSDSDGRDTSRATAAPFRVKLPQLLIDEEVGLGDVVVKLTGYVTGAEPCGGCTRRAAALNRWVLFIK
jgi:hypothetical protein